MEIHTYSCIALTRRDLFNECFHPPSIWKATLARYVKNVHAVEYEAKAIVAKWLGRGNSLDRTPIRHLRAALYPLASLGKWGELVWTTRMRTELERVGVKLPTSTASSSNIMEP